jgi:hypothetical protein
MIESLRSPVEPGKKQQSDAGEPQEKSGELGTLQR